MKLSQVLRGKRAESKPVEVPGFGFSTIFVPITGLEHEAACVAARERAVEKGSPKPEEGDPVYDLALMANVVLAGSLDPDSPEEARTKTFESAEEILRELHPEHIVFLHEQHERHQDENSPYEKKIPAVDFFTKVREVAGPDGLAVFMRWSPSTRWNFMRSTATALLDVLGVKSTATSPSAPSASKPSAEPPRRRPRPRKK